MSDRTTTERILINATQDEEVRIALTSDQFLENIFIEEFGSHRTGNIYKGKITRVVPSLQAAFVDYGSQRHGFLPLKEVSPEYFRTQLSQTDNDQYSIADVLKEGQELIVQVEKEERGNKGAALTSFITLAGCYLVLMPNNPRAGGISRRIEGDEREEIKALMNALSIPDNMGLIIRTAGVGKAVEELQWDLDVLLKLWDAIQNAGQTQPPPCLIHEESDVVIRAFRDYLRKDVSEIIIDDTQLYERAKNHLAKISPEIIERVKLYEDKAIPLFSRYHIENQIETAFQRDVQLPSGGYIVIQETEALVSVDVNSARDTKSDDIEKTAFNTNREAAIEVARQLRLRDLGGLIVIDFIDMMSGDHQQQIVDTFREEIRNDKARVQYGRISRFGLLEISRQRLRPSLREGSQIVCPRCSGLGSIRSVESLSLYILRLMRHESMNDNVAEVIVQVPVDVAAFLLNEKRHMLDEIEKHHKVLLRIIPNPHILTPEYKIERVYNMQSSQLGRASYTHLEAPELTIAPSKIQQKTKVEPVVKTMETPIKPVVKKKKISLIQRLIKLFTKEEKKSSQTNKHGRHHTQRNRNNNNQRRNTGGQQQRRHQGQQRRHSGGNRSQNNDNRNQDNDNRRQNNDNRQQNNDNQRQGNDNRRQNNNNRRHRQNRQQGGYRNNRPNDNERQNQQNVAATQPAVTQTNTAPVAKPEFRQAPKPQQQQRKPVEQNNKPVEPINKPTTQSSAPKPVQQQQEVKSTPVQKPTQSQQVVNEPVIEIVIGPRPGDKARQYHQNKMKAKKQNPYKHKIQQKIKAEVEKEPSSKDD